MKFLVCLVRNFQINFIIHGPRNAMIAISAVLSLYLYHKSWVQCLIRIESGNANREIATYPLFEVVLSYAGAKYTYIVIPIVVTYPKIVKVMYMYKIRPIFNDTKNKESETQFAIDRVTAMHLRRKRWLVAVCSRVKKLKPLVHFALTWTCDFYPVCNLKPRIQRCLRKDLNSP